MRMYDVIAKKRDGHELTSEEIYGFIEGYVDGSIPDYQASALLMAIFFNGMNEREILDLTTAMMKSGDQVDLSPIEGIKVDKHSTGGVGDKTSLIVAPIVAACGVKVAKMSGRGLGHTGGTVDKLESIPGFRTDLNEEEFFDVVRKTGISVIGQSGNLTPADKKLYALRDVTATVESIPLIASSIMSKKLAAGSDCIVLDVKTGSGAFMKTVESSVKLAETMVKLGENARRRTCALITDMDVPLGKNIGNSLEVIEAVDTLKGKGPEDLTHEALYLAANMLELAGKGDEDTCMKLAQSVIDDLSALNCLKEMVKAQHGDVSVIEDTDNFIKAKYSYEVKADRAGYIAHMDTEGCGIASMMLGAGRETLDSKIDMAAGIIIEKKTGDRVEKGDLLATLYADDEKLFDKAEQKYKESIIMSDEAVKRNPLLYAKVSRDGIKYF
ncbi:MAG: pyrimidine-nucleoside phosphorylase [Lachnospiraceae bacterium]|nr:pyrimidine-nucleoside phosphorylase [Lachnospiraceae bacterium]